MTQRSAPQLICSIDDKGRIRFLRDARRMLHTREYVFLHHDEDNVRLCIEFLQHKQKGAVKILWDHPYTHLSVPSKKYYLSGRKMKYVIQNRYELFFVKRKRCWCIRLDKPLK